jgi:hypothetical protein
MRVDDLVRTERYFCTLLLPLLLDDAFDGVRALVELLVALPARRGPSGNRVPSSPRPDRDDRHPFSREPDTGGTGVHFHLGEHLARAEDSNWARRSKR